MSDTGNQPPKLPRPKAPSASKGRQRGAEKGKRSETPPQGPHNAHRQEGEEAGFKGFPAPERGPFEEAAAKGGRPSDVCPGLIQEFVELIGRRGNSIARACRLLGVDRALKDRWLELGQRDIDEGHTETLYAKFSLLVPRSRDDLYQAITQHMARLAMGDDAAKGNFFWLKDMLALFFPETGLEVRQHMDGNITRVLERLEKVLPPEQYELALKAITEED